MAESVSDADLRSRLTEIYPFDDNAECRRIWEDALAAQGLTCASSVAQEEGVLVNNHAG